MRSCCLSLLIFLSFCLPLFAQKTKGKTPKKNKKFVVLIDAGHGGIDPGKLSSNPDKFRHEKHIVLGIALKLGGYLEQYLDDVQVIYTRIKDKSISLEERAELANNEKVDLLVSIHCNSSPDSTIYGTFVHIHQKINKKSYALAKMINYQLDKRAHRPNKGIQTLKDRGHNLYVLQYSEMPSVLIETGFLSNPQEERYLNSEHGQAIIASAIFRAIRSYKKKYK